MEWVSSLTVGGVGVVIGAWLIFALGYILGHRVGERTAFAKGYLVGRMDGELLVEFDGDFKIDDK